MRYAVEIEDVSKKYGEVSALEHVTFSVPEGGVFGLIGPDGAGKTTLYQILSTLLVPDEGRAMVAGWDVVKDDRRLRQEIGYMPENFSLYPDLTVEENLHFFASLFKVDVKDSFELIAPIFGQLATGFELRVDTPSQSSAFGRTDHRGGCRVKERILGYAGHLERERHHDSRVHILYGRGRALRRDCFDTQGENSRRGYARKVSRRVEQEYLQRKVREHVSSS